MVEVVAKRDYRSDEESDLFLKKGDHLLILRIEGDMYQAKKDEMSGLIPIRELGKFKPPEWFQMTDRKGAEEILKEKGKGKFLIRPTQHGKDGEFSISVVFEDDSIHHFKLQKTAKNKLSLYGDEFESLQEVVKKYQKKTIAKNTNVLLDTDAETEVDNQTEDDYEDGYYDPYYTNEDDDDYDYGYGAAGLDDDDEDDVNDGIAVARVDYQARQKGEISIRKNERLIVIELMEDDWIFVRKTTGEQGMVDKKYLEIL